MAVSCAAPQSHEMPGDGQALQAAVQEDEETGRPELDRQISWTAACRDHSGAQDFRLVGCSGPSPTCMDEPEAPKFEFIEFQRKAAQLVDEFVCSHDVQGMISSVVALG